MSRVAFKQCDIERILRAGRKARVPVHVRVERKTGDLIIEAVDDSPSLPQPDEAGSFWDTYNEDPRRA